MSEIIALFPDLPARKQTLYANNFLGAYKLFRVKCLRASWKVWERGYEIILSLAIRRQILKG